MDISTRKNYGLEVGFALRGKAQNVVISEEPANGRLCWIRLKDRFYNKSIICTHIPTEVSENNIHKVTWRLPDFLCDIR